MPHRVMTLYGAGPGTFYPAAVGVVWAANTYQATTTVADSVFADGSRDAVIRSAFIGFSGDTPAPTVELFDAETPSLQVYEFDNLRGTPAVAIFGPDGFSLPKGFLLKVFNNPGTIIIVYDVV